MNEKCSVVTDRKCLLTTFSWVLRRRIADRWYLLLFKVHRGCGALFCTYCFNVVVNTVFKHWTSVFGVHWSWSWLSKAQSHKLSRTPLYMCCHPRKRPPFIEGYVALTFSWCLDLGPWSLPLLCCTGCKDELFLNLQDGDKTVLMLFWIIYAIDLDSNGRQRELWWPYINHK